MSAGKTAVEDLVSREYKEGFYSDLESDSIPPGLNEDVIRMISAKKGEPEFLLEWRLKAYRQWLTMEDPQWAKVKKPVIDFDSIVYYSAPKQKSDGPKSLDEVDPELLRIYERLASR